MAGIGIRTVRWWGEGGDNGDGGFRGTGGLRAISDCLIGGWGNCLIVGGDDFLVGGDWHGN